MRLHILRILWIFFVLFITDGKLMADKKNVRMMYSSGL